MNDEIKRLKINYDYLNHLMINLESQINYTLSKENDFYVQFSIYIEDFENAQRDLWLLEKFHFDKYYASRFESEGITLSKREQLSFEIRYSFYCNNKKAKRVLFECISSLKDFIVEKLEGSSVVKINYKTIEIDANGSCQLFDKGVIE